MDLQPFLQEMSVELFELADAQNRKGAMNEDKTLRSIADNCLQLAADASRINREEFINLLADIQAVTIDVGFFKKQRKRLGDLWDKPTHQVDPTTQSHTLKLNESAHRALKRLHDVIIENLVLLPDNSNHVSTEQITKWRKLCEKKPINPSENQSYLDFLRDIRIENHPTNRASIVAEYAKKMGLEQYGTDTELKDEDVVNKCVDAQFAAYIDEAISKNPSLASYRALLITSMTNSISGQELNRLNFMELQQRLLFPKNSDINFQINMFDSCTSRTQVWRCDQEGLYCDLHEVYYGFYTFEPAENTIFAFGDNPLIEVADELIPHSEIASDDHNQFLYMGRELKPIAEIKSTVRVTPDAENNWVNLRVSKFTLNVLSRGVALRVDDNELTKLINPHLIDQAKEQTRVL